MQPTPHVDMCTHQAVSTLALQNSRLSENLSDNPFRHAPELALQNSRLSVDINTFLMQENGPRSNPPLPWLGRHQSVLHVPCGTRPSQLSQWQKGTEGKQGGEV
eukprot:1156791-Pelagomonas_calceolata.AAC.1